MAKSNTIITVGLNPCWDITCTVEGLAWGEHKTLLSQTCHPAGKPLNVSRSLAWMGVPTVATGLWGSDDYDALLSELKAFPGQFDPRFVRVNGATRKNISILDSVHHRDTHLRCNAELASPQAIGELQALLEDIVHANDYCLFAGSLGCENHFENIVRVIEGCERKGVRVALDTSGNPLKALVDKGNLWLIKPNVLELRELLQSHVEDEAESLIEAGRSLLDRVDIILISRGAQGAIAVTEHAAVSARWDTPDQNIVNTVASGDFLLAGFLKGMRENAELGDAIVMAVQAATSRCLGWDRQRAWGECLKDINVRSNTCQ